MSHSSLLLQRTVILNGENHWIRRCYKCTAVDSFYNRSKWNLGGECVSMIDERRSIIPIPTVQFHTAAPSKKHLMTCYTLNELHCFCTVSPFLQHSEDDRSQITDGIVYILWNMDIILC